MSEELHISDDSAVRMIEIDRPDSKNGLTEEVNRRIIEALDDAGQRQTIRCVVIGGRGGNFCSGLDLKVVAGGTLNSGLEDLEQRMRVYFHGLIRAVRRLEKPVIAFVDGAAVGFGCDLALACDLRIATERARFGEIFVKRALMPDGGGTYTLPRLVGVGKALELLLLGDLVDADTALQIGLVNQVVPVNEGLASIKTLAARLAAGPPLVHAAMKRAVYAGQGGTFDEALENELRGQMALLRTKDFVEGLSAFFQKRLPNFKGE
jgi:2-(1,2-epoxy-1,2-dihydrophenyl)acetyl-CoA isomerase